MKQFGRIMSRMFAAALAVALVGTASVIPSVGRYFGTEITANALAKSPVVTVGDFQYVLYEDKTANVVGYVGKKDMSKEICAMPSVLYAKDISTTWEYNDYISRYTVTGLQASIFNGCKIKMLSLPRLLQNVVGGFTGAEIGGFTIDSANSYFSVTNNVYALYDKSGTTLYAYPSNQSLYSAAYSGVMLKSGVTRIEDQAFANCKLYKINIPSSVTYMGDRVFIGSSVGTIVFDGNSPSFRFLPEQSNDHGTFEGASKLDMITITGTAGNYNTYNGALYNKDKTKLLLCPQGRTTSSYFMMAATTTEIGAYAFYRCANLNAVSIPETVKTISPDAFYRAKSDMVFYGMQDSYAQTYANDNGKVFIARYPYVVNDDGTLTITGYNDVYTGVTVPSQINGKTVSAIGSRAFINNTRITVVSIPYGIKTIGEHAFRGCENLTKAILPASLTKISPYAFYHCTSLESIKIPDSVTSIGAFAFYGCTSLEEAVIGKSVQSIGNYAFENTALTNVTLPPSVTFIGSYAFGYHYEDELHARVDFDYIAGHPATIAESYAEKHEIPFKSYFDYEVNADGKTVIITKYNGEDADVTVPSEIGGKNVTSIKRYAFNGSKAVTVRLPDTITEIAPYAFYGAHNLQTVLFPSTLTSIGQYAFEFCTSLENVTFPASLKAIGNGAFYGCTSLKSVNLNLSLASIGRAAFANTALTNVYIPLSVTTLGDYAFAYTYDNSQQYKPVKPFTMKGYVDTAAYDYARNNSHITFDPFYQVFTGSIKLSADEIDLGQTVTITANAAGGKKPYNYRAEYLKEGAAAWSILQNYSETSVIPFTPTEAGNYTIRVYTRDYRGVLINEECVLTVNSVAPLKNESTLSKLTINLGDSVIATGKASGGKTPYLYGVYYKKTTSENWSTAQSYKSNAKVTITPKAAVKYDVCVKVKDATGKIEKKYFVVEVVKPLTNNSTLSAETIKKGESVTAAGKASGGKTPYLYGVYYKKATSETWSTAQSYKSNAKVTITPAAAVKYDVCVKVKDAAGKIEKKYFTLTVTK